VEEIVLSAALNQEVEWNYRLTEKRLVIVKTKNESARKLAVLDVLSNLIFAVQALESIDMKTLKPNGEYVFTLKVNSSKKLEDVDRDFLAFFEAVDINQSFEDFIKAYWVYPAKILFELTEVEEA
jgi:hypothetical protein